MTQVRDTRHSPGPWRVIAGHEHSEDCPLNVWSADGRIVAAIVGQGDHLLDPATEEGCANARLIAAAPMLLGALRGLVRFIGTDGHALSMVPEDDWNAARWAIANATEGV